MDVSNLRVFKEERDVSNVFGLTRNMADAGGRNGRRFCWQHIIHNRKIMDGQIPNHVYIVLEESEINAYGVVVVDVAQGVRGDQLPNLSHGASVDKGVIHHQNTLTPGRFFN